MCIEWPTACAYWKWDCVEKLVEMLGLKTVRVHGCALGLKSVVNGKPIKKPWTLKTDVEDIVENLEKYKCSNDHEHHPCAGKDTKLTESYTPEMVVVIHKSFKQFLAKCRKTNASKLAKLVVAAPAVVTKRSTALFHSKPLQSPTSKHPVPSPWRLGCEAEQSFPVNRMAGSSAAPARVTKVELDTDEVSGWKTFFTELSLRFLRNLQRSSASTLARAGASASQLMERALATSAFSRSCNLTQVGVKWLTGELQATGGESLIVQEEEDIAYFDALEIPPSPPPET